MVLDFFSLARDAMLVLVIDLDQIRVHHVLFAPLSE